MQSIIDDENLADNITLGADASWGDIMEKAQEREEDLWDAKGVLIGDLEFTLEKSCLRVGFPGAPSGGLPTTNWAVGQIFKNLGMPADYFRKIIAGTGRADPELTMDHIFHWKNEYETSKVLIRGRQGGQDSIRAMVSNHYVDMPYSGIVDILSKTCGDARFAKYGFHPQQVQLSDHMFRLLVTTRVPIVEDEAGSRMYPGFIVTSSDNGARSYKMEYCEYKSSCTNGMIFGKIAGGSYQHDHIGDFGSKQVFTTFFKFCDGFSDQMDLSVARIENAKKMKFDKERAEIILAEWHVNKSLFNEAWKLKYGEDDSITETDFWTMMNGVTEIAQQKTPDLRYRLETSMASALVALGG